MPSVSIADLPRYLFAPYVAAVCFFILDNQGGLTLLQNMNATGLVAVAIGGVLFYFAYRVTVFPTLQLLYQIVLPKTVHKYIRERYKTSGGGTMRLHSPMLHRIFIATVKDLVVSQRLKGLNSAVHGMFQSSIVCTLFLVVVRPPLGSQANYAFIGGAILGVIVGLLLSKSTEDEDVLTVQHHLGKMDKAAFLLGLKLAPGQSPGIKRRVQQAPSAVPKK